MTAIPRGLFYPRKRTGFGRFHYPLVLLHFQCEPDQRERAGFEPALLSFVKQSALGDDWRRGPTFAGLSAACDAQEEPISRP